MKTAEQWLKEYGESHQNETNKAVHWICVPLIFSSITGLFYCIKFSWMINGIAVNAAMILIILVTIYYLRLSVSLAIGMFLFGVAVLIICQLIEKNVPAPLWAICIIIFIVAWIGQFYGHNIEGKKPSFLKDLQFLLIGPMWLMSFIYKKIGIQF